MKKALILLTSAVALLALAIAPGCSGGGDDDDDGGTGLDNGTYAVGGLEINPNTCGGTGNFYDQFSTADVIATAVSFDIDFEGVFQTTYEITGTSLYDPASPGNTEIDFNDPAVALTANGFASTYDCVLDAGENYEGSITGNNEFVLTDRYTYDITSGTECPIVATSAGVPLPCEDSQNATLTL
jgi:hypothetical protein